MAVLLSRATVQAWLLPCGVESLIWVVLVPHNFNKNTRPAVHTLLGFPGLTGSQTHSLHAPLLPAQRLPEVWQKREDKLVGSIVCAESTLRSHRHSSLLVMHAQGVF